MLMIDNVYSECGRVEIREVGRAGKERVSQESAEKVRYEQSELTGGSYESC